MTHAVAVLDGQHHFRHTVRECESHFWSLFLSGGGRRYNLTVTLHKTGITLDNCTIMPWDEGACAS